MVPSNSPLAWFPPSWKPLVKSLLSRRAGLGSKMLENLMRGRICEVDRDEASCSAPDWYSLLQALTNQEPVLNDAGIHMRSHFVLLPFHVQKTFLTLLESHKSELPIHMLQQFVTSVRDHVTDDWCKLYLHLLHIHMISSYSVSMRSQEIINRGFVSQSSGKMFDNLCEKLKQDQSSHSSLGSTEPGMNCDWLKDTLAAQTRHPDWLASVSTSQRTDSLSSRKRKISLETVGNLDKSTMKSSEKRVRLEISVDDIFPTGEAEIGQETELEVNSRTMEVPDEEIDKSPDMDLWKEKLEATYAPLQEVLQSTRGSLTPAEVDLLKSFVALPSAEIKIICDAVSMDSLSSNLLAAVCQQLVAMPTNYISFMTTKILAKRLFGRKLTDLNQTAPRNLVVTLCQFAQRYSSALLEGCIVPHLQEGAIMGQHQGDLILKVAKESLDNDGRLSLLRTLLLNRRLEWSDPVTIFVQGIISCKIVLIPDILDELFTSLDAHHATQSKCPKFAKLLVAIINKSQKQLTAAHKTIIQGIIDDNQTFLKKTLAAALKKSL